MQMQAEGIGSWLKYRGKVTPEKEAIVEGDKRINYRDLNIRVNRAARALQKLGVKPGDRVSIIAFNCIEFVELIMGAAKIGAMLVPLNWRLTPYELTFIVTDSGAQTLIFDEAFAKAVEEIKGKAALKNYVSLGGATFAFATKYEDLLAKQSETEPIPEKEVGLETPHLIIYTAGTTGKPKGAVLTQGASFWNAVNVIVPMDITSQDRNLMVVPMFHIGGIGLFTLPMLYIGGTAVITRTFDPAKALDLMKKEKITIFMGVPAIFLFLAQQPDFDVLKNVRIVMSGGAPLPVSLVKMYDSKGIRLGQGFGMSEAGPSVTVLDRDKYLTKAGSIGSCLMHLETRVVDDNMNDVKPGETGELIYRGPNVLIEYWNRPDATEEAFRGSWFHSGDIARIDADGDLYIVDRKKDMYISGGENVYPAEVENALYELPEIAENAVIGIPDKKWGEVGKAIVVLKKGKELSEEQILTHLKTRLAKFKVPASVAFTDVLPRNAMQKVLKNELRQKFA
jgi:fatty-acyl-CoA synthase